MFISFVDVWVSKVRDYGWKIEDVPINIRDEVKKALKEKTISCNDWIKENKKV